MRIEKLSLVNDNDCIRYHYSKRHIDKDIYGTGEERPIAFE